jgi:hypothetical protein
MWALVLEDVERLHQKTAFFDRDLTVTKSGTFTRLTNGTHRKILDYTLQVLVHF